MRRKKAEKLAAIGVTLEEWEVPTFDCASQPTPKSIIKQVAPRRTGRTGNEEKRKEREKKGAARDQW
jgi:hypothetical protein